jgi:hypothetical protein
METVPNALKNPSDLDDEDITRALRELKEEEAAELRRRLEGPWPYSTPLPDGAAILQPPLPSTPSELA